MKLKTIKANIPIIGNTKIHFYADSCIYWEFIDENEIGRLNRIPHLGTCSIAFAGANHSRLEYTYLQCTVIELVKKIHKDSSSIEISSGVKLYGFDKPASSGQEVLKLWSLLSSYGRMNWTYGTERTLLQLCYDNKDLQKWLLNDIRDGDLKKWCKKVIDNYDDYLFNYVVAIKRIYMEAKPYDRNKNKLLNYLKNLLLPTEILFPDDLKARYKLHNLRQLFQNIRLVCIASIDSYYSHTATRFQLSTSITDISLFVREIWTKESKIKELERLIGYLANNLYYNVKSTPIQRAYEVRKKGKMRKSILNSQNDSDKSISVCKAWLHNGLGRPSESDFSHIIRLTFKNHYPFGRYFGFNNKYELQKHLESKIGSQSNIYLTVENNYYKNELLIDLHYTKGTHISVIGKSLINLEKWIVRKTLAQFRERVSIVSGLNHDQAQQFRKFVVENLIDDTKHLFDQFLFSIVKLLIPENWNIEIRDFIPKNSEDSPVLYKLNFEENFDFNNTTSKLEKHLKKNPYKFDSDRLQEIKAIDRLVKYSRSEITLSCAESIVITNNHGKTEDEWDGLILKIDDSKLNLIIIETKNYQGASTKNENEALKQLDDSKLKMTQKFKVKYEKKRIKDLGARLILKLAEG